MKKEIKKILDKLSNDNLDTTKYGDGYQQGLVDVAESLECNTDKNNIENFLSDKGLFFDKIIVTRDSDYFKIGELIQDYAEYLESNKTDVEGLSKKDIFKKHFNKFSKIECDESILKWMNFCLDAMEEYAQSLSKPKGEDVEIITENSSNTKLGGFTDAC